MPKITGEYPATSKHRSLNETMPDNTTKRRVIRTTITAGATSTFTATANLADHVGMAQHTVYAGCQTVPANGVIAVSVRAAKSGFWVPLGSVTVNGTASGQLVFQGVLDAIKLSTSTPVSAGSSVESGVLSVGLDFTPTGNRSTVDRARFAADFIATGWNGSAITTKPLPQHGSYTQHQLAITGGSGAVKLLCRPTGAAVYVDIGQGLDSIDSSGSLVIFTGLYDAFALQPVGTVTGSIQAQVISIGEELMMPMQAWQVP